MAVHLEKLVVPAVITLATASFLLLARFITIRVLHRWAGKTATKADDIIIGSLKTPSIYWAIAIGIYVGLATSDLPAKYVVYPGKAINALVILSITVAIATLSEKIFNSYVQRMELPIPATGLAQGILKGTIYIVGILIVLTVIGISITPLVTALGVGGLAVALALQDTLANLFAGIHILVEKSMRIGDFIKLETGQEGYIDDITWRTTRIRMLPNNMVIIPNNKLSQSIVTNYSMPEKRMSLPIPISVSYSSDPEIIEKILVEEAKRAAGEVQGLLSAPEPSVRFIPGFGPSSLDFTLICHINEFVDQYLVQHELRKRIFKRFLKEGIEIPFPQRTVHMRKDDG
ncbi:MAG: mechanosensitive ion channel family protein [Deltaproteobacteria bacterium]